MKSAVKSVRDGGRGLQHRGKSAYREMRSKMRNSSSGTNLEGLRHHHNRRREFGEEVYPGSSEEEGGSSGGSSSSPRGGGGGGYTREHLSGAGATSSAPSSPVLKNRTMSVSSRSKCNVLEIVHVIHARVPIPAYGRKSNLLYSRFSSRSLPPPPWAPPPLLPTTTTVATAPPPPEEAPP